MEIFFLARGKVKVQARKNRTGGKRAENQFSEEGGFSHSPKEPP